VVHCPAAPRTVSTGTVDARTTRSATLPKTRCLSPRRPRVAITTRSAPSRCGVAIIRLPGSPTSTASSRLTPAREYSGHTLFQPTPCGFHLRIVKVFAGESWAAPWRSADLFARRAADRGFRRNFSRAPRRARARQPSLGRCQPDKVFCDTGKASENLPMPITRNPLPMLHPGPSVSGSWSARLLQGLRLLRSRQPRRGRQEKASHEPSPCRSVRVRVLGFRLIARKSGADCLPSSC
jgi:hypothetical protein